MFKIYKCEVRDKKKHLIKDEETKYVRELNSHESNNYYQIKKKVGGKVAGDYHLYYYDLKDMETGKLFSMKTEHDIEIDDKPLYVGAEVDDIVAFSKNKMTNDGNNYTMIETKSSGFKLSDIFYGIVLFVLLLVPLISVGINWYFIKSGTDLIKTDYKEYPALIIKGILSCIAAYQVYIYVIAMISGSHNFFNFIQAKTFSTGMLSILVILLSVGYFKLTRQKNLEQFKTLK
jgi:hypothetical protein